MDTPNDCYIGHNYWDDYYEEVYIGMVGSSYVTGMEVPTGKKAKARRKARKKRTFGFSAALDKPEKS